MKNTDKPRMAGHYVEAFSWHGSIRDFLEKSIKERPLLNVCAGPTDDFGDVRMDLYVKPIPPAVIGDWTRLPFASDSFGAVFADPPWSAAYMKACSDFCREALRVASVAYVMSPWLWVERWVRRTNVWVREFPGIQVPILLVRYERIRDQKWLF